jgi:hypothetical protein
VEAEVGPGRRIGQWDGVEPLDVRDGEVCWFSVKWSAGTLR